MKAILQQLEQLSPGGYDANGPVATEPTAWATIALARAGCSEAAERGTHWLADLQKTDGSVSVHPDVVQPNWTTSLAILAWHAVDSARYSSQIDSAAQWLLDSKGKAGPKSDLVGHDTTLIGWSWAADTHSWLEPTAFAAMALRTAGYQTHARSTEAIQLLTDRLLPNGGCNYGNTIILGQTLVPHLQPSGVVLWALAGEGATDPRVAKSLDYLEHQIARPTGCASLAFAILALTAWGRRPANADQLIAQAAERTSSTGSTYKLALLAFAALDEPIKPNAPGANSLAESILS